MGKVHKKSASLVTSPFAPPYSKVDFKNSKKVSLSLHLLYPVIAIRRKGFILG